MGKVLCFGELLLRMSPALNQQWIQQACMPVYVGGAELNVAQALALWNIPVKYFSAAPDHYLTHEIVASLEAKNIDASGIHYSGNRIGTYYLPQGVDLKNAGVIYDRAHSSFATLEKGMINWNTLLEGVEWFHFSAICPALSESVAAVCKEALQAARSKGIKISVDLNYRARLWQYGKKPVEVMPELVQYCQVVMGNLWAVDTMLGIESPVKESNGKTKKELTEAAGISMLGIRKVYPQVTDMAYTFRLDKSYFAVMQQGSQMALSKEHLLGNIIDKVGSGDCFMAGLIMGLYRNNPVQDIIDYAAAAAVGKLYVTGDATNQAEAEIRKTI